MARILITGALGQIGSELVPALRDHHGGDQVVASDIRMVPSTAGPPEHLDCTDPGALQEIVRRFDIGTIYHMAAILSATAEEKPHAAWKVNMDGIYRVLEVARGSVREIVNTPEFKGVLDDKFKVMMNYLTQDVIPKQIRRMTGG